MFNYHRFYSSKIRGFLEWKKVYVRTLLELTNVRKVSYKYSL